MSKIYHACLAMSKHQRGEGSLVSALLALHRSKHRYHEPQVYKWSLVWGFHSRHQSHAVSTQGSLSFGVVVEESQPEPEGLHSKTLPLLQSICSPTLLMSMRISPVTLCLKSLTFSCMRGIICFSKGRASSRLVSGIGQTK